MSIDSTSIKTKTTSEKIYSYKAEKLIILIKISQNNDKKNKR